MKYPCHSEREVLQQAQKRPIKNREKSPYGKFSQFLEAIASTVKLQLSCLSSITEKKDYSWSGNLS